MLETLLMIFAIGLAPALFSLMMMQKAEAQARERLRIAMHASAARRVVRYYAYPLSADHHYVEGVGYLIGDVSCRFNARSSYLRCAINPSGPCSQCSHYESVPLETNV